jgi:PAS domain S-box-containing protein
MSVAPADRAGWASLFDAAFKKSRNPMALVDHTRSVVNVNAALLRLVGYKRDDLIGRPLYEMVAAGPLVSADDWTSRLAEGEFAGETGVITADGTVVDVQWGATTEVVTGRHLVLFVVTNTSRWGDRFRRDLTAEAQNAALSRREAEIVHLVALGASGPEIADDLGIAHDTVRTHVRNAMAKLGARSRAHLVAKALGDGLALG